MHHRSQEKVYGLLLKTSTTQKKLLGTFQEHWSLQNKNKKMEAVSVRYRLRNQTVAQNKRQVCLLDCFEQRIMGYRNK